MLGATNCPWDLDAAIRRRFEKRIYIPLPEMVARRKMVDLGIGGQPNIELTDKDKEFLASRMAGYSAADISIMCRTAMYGPISKAVNAKWFKQVYSQEHGKMMWMPCSPGDADPSKIESHLAALGSDVMKPPCVMDDFLKAVDNTPTSVGEEDLKRQEEWTVQYGVEG